jgi:hypothetical protein
LLSPHPVQATATTATTSCLGLLLAVCSGQAPAISSQACRCVGVVVVAVVLVVVVLVVLVVVVVAAVVVVVFLNIFIVVVSAVIVVVVDAAHIGRSL